MVCVIVLCLQSSEKGKPESESRTPNCVDHGGHGGHSTTPMSALSATFEKLRLHDSPTQSPTTATASASAHIQVQKKNAASSTQQKQNAISQQVPR